MKKPVLITVVILVAAIGGAIYLATNRPASKRSSSTTVTSKTTTTDGKTELLPVDIKINADDYHADKNVINVTKGAHVNITFAVEQEANYSDGLVFRTADSKLNTGTVKPGTSKTLSFTATEKVEFLPFWPNGGPQKNYSITVNGT